ncbi:MULTISPECIES: hypothetical protein [Klebsiella]|uniref:hypothetical protein n=1 Tax=Klebsiella TaxID=570 RepID=UPI0015A628B1|nr:MULTISPECIES: hypothetical protein [Klebsiella]HBX6120958.1 hypothetical protein [Klebsiella pneumoniae]MCJ3087325.1 hypothetical protein [Klebsiella quasipneumoniae]GKO53625.1 hypothetical protein MS6016_09020 [Klebsiella variicola]HCB0464032.1 hypothetical protein [Klebsiella pneumoniae]HCC2485371.1 hypothetical protein [Klebsiella pneumoniae]
MNKLNIWIRFLILFLACLLFATEDKRLYTLLEQSAAGVIGSILGGITAGIAVIFGILAVINKDNNNAHFSKYLINLELDLKILIACLGMSIFLPYFRNYDIPILNYPTHYLIPSKMRLFTALELFSIILSLNIIMEVISCMILVVKASLKK